MRFRQVLLSALLAALLLCPFYLLADITEDGLLVQPTTGASYMSRWRNLGTIAAQTATLAVNARDYSTVNALAGAVTWDVINDGTVHEFRFRTDADADAHTVELWLCPDDTMHRSAIEEVYTLGIILDLTGGTADAYGSASSSYGDSHFVDTIVLDTEGILTGYEIVDSGNNRQAIFRCDLRGWGKLAVIASTYEAATTLYVDERNL